MEDQAFYNFAQFLSKIAEKTCAPFWWSIQKNPKEPATILHNGTICFVDTGSAELGVTANHVYEQWLKDLAEFGDDTLECQFGGSTIYPEKHAIAQSIKRDLATFVVPEVFVTASMLTNRTHHHALTWPPDRLKPRERVLLGGYPGILRKEKGETADLPFQWSLGVVDDAGDANIVVLPFDDLHWLSNNEAINTDLRGCSGGPVYRLVEVPFIRLELAGFIHEFVDDGKAVLARHADFVLADGKFVF